MSGYAELVCSSNFSFLTGASHPEELVVQARNLGYAALAITDECSLAGVVKAYAEHKENPGELRLIIGARFRLASEDAAEALSLVLLATDRAAYAELSGLITLGRRRCGKGDYFLAVADVTAHIHRCLAILTPGDISSRTTTTSAFAATTPRHSVLAFPSPPAATCSCTPPSASRYWTWSPPSA
ncbi:MAG: dnaE2 [Moraxellaceae bacterium]|nr:dnaE2 [Moraxellaceae bacterium]